MKRYWVRRQVEDGDDKHVAGPYSTAGSAIMTRDALQRETDRPEVYYIHPPVESD